MAGKYIISVCTDFSAAHAIRGYVGDCARIHGHNWKMKAEVQTTMLDTIGIGIDFKQIKKAMQDILETIDHQYLNEIPPFDTINPTAENIAAWFFKSLKAHIENDVMRLLSVTLWETDRSSVQYSE